MQRCQKCDHDGKRLDGVSEIAFVDYYRCPKCGEVWTTPKDEEGSSAPEPILASSANAAA